LQNTITYCIQTQAGSGLMASIQAFTCHTLYKSKIFIQNKIVIYLFISSYIDISIFWIRRIAKRIA
jgi:hypothetical protein